MAELNTPLQVGDVEISNRLVLAPLTRARSGEIRVPNDLNVEYYRQRANAGLMLTEAIVISPTAVGYEHTPGLYNAEQVAGWKKSSMQYTSKVQKFLLSYGMWDVFLIQTY